MKRNSKKKLNKQTTKNKNANIKAKMNEKETVQYEKTKEFKIMSPYWRQTTKQSKSQPTTAG